jgi:hypothetical protein
MAASVNGYKSPQYPARILRQQRILRTIGQTDLKPAVGVRALRSFSQLRESLSLSSPVRKCQYCKGKLSCRLVLTPDVVMGLLKMTVHTVTQ